MALPSGHDEDADADANALKCKFFAPFGGSGFSYASSLSGNSAIKLHDILSSTTKC